ncbi:hypothetical protein BAE30_14180 [Acidithiobacillus caldus]|uniref:Uncharacterized protein n=1 Tax=Acidithiobacillus caldus TaxID=33059 RepID=A0A1E7YSF4_9PROT|nr:hypothetical protein BAE30_14180 [Acidithiobacillus caldus]
MGTGRRLMALVVHSRLLLLPQYLPDVFDFCLLGRIPQGFGFRLLHSATANGVVETPVHQGFHHEQ